jgi:hypothetical protein
VAGGAVGPHIALVRLQGGSRQHLVDHVGRRRPAVFRATAAFTMDGVTSRRCPPLRLLSGG